MQKKQNKVLVFLPCYNCESQIERVLLGLSEIKKKSDRWELSFLIIDNCSHDGTIERAKLALQKYGIVDSAWIIKNTENYGLGGSHKVAFSFAFGLGTDYMGVFHGDGQASASDLFGILSESLKHPNLTILGSRFSQGSRLFGYSAARKWGNLMLNSLYGFFLRAKIDDLGSGLNLFYLPHLNLAHLLSCSDDFVFNMDLTCLLNTQKISTMYFPIQWSQEDQLSNAKIWKVGVRSLSVILRWWWLGTRQFDQPSIHRTYTVIAGPMEKPEPAK